MKAINVGLIGLGTVGRGTLDVLNRNKDEIFRRAGRPIHVIAAAVRNPEKHQDAQNYGLELTQDPYDIVNNPDIDIVVEVIGGDGVAKEVILKALENEKDVVTANKALIALHGNEIFKMAQDKGVIVAFESAVAGGIPVIKSIREGLAANRIEWLAGIINGTSNYILTEMLENGSAFEDVLKVAQELGYAEADPSFDVEGIDAAHKLAILTSIAFGIPLQFDKVYVEGINKLEVADIQFAESLGYRIKHIGFAKRAEQGIEARVHPVLVPKSSMMASVNGVMNAVLVHADAVGSTMYYGAGAGAEPTASAVVADIIDVVRTITTDPENRVPHLAFQPQSLTNIDILDIEQAQSAYYLRLTVQHKPGVLAAITQIFADNDISIRSILQTGDELGHSQAETVSIVIMTESSQERNMNQTINALQALTAVLSDVVRIRVEELY